MTRLTQWRGLILVLMTAVRVNAAGGLLQFDEDSATGYDAFAFLDAILNLRVDTVGGTNLHLSLLEEFRVYLHENEVIAHLFHNGSTSDAQSLVGRTGGDKHIDE